MGLSERIQSADWKTEKHVPVIECPERVKADELFEVKVSLGKEIAHPNTTEHHIRWIKIFSIRTVKNSLMMLLPLNSMPMVKP